MSVVRRAHRPTRPVRRRLTAVLAVLVTTLGLLITGAGAARAEGVNQTYTQLAFAPATVVLAGSSVTVQVQARGSSNNKLVGHGLGLAPLGGTASVRPLDPALHPRFFCPIPASTPCVPNDIKAGYTDGSGNAYFTVTPHTVGVQCFEVDDPGNGGAVADPPQCLIVEPADSLTQDSTVTASVSRVEPDGIATSTIVVQAQRGGVPVTDHSVEVSLAVTELSPEPTATLPYGEGFFGGETLHDVNNQEISLPEQPTNDNGVAVFTVKNNADQTMAYFTPVFFTASGAGALSSATSPSTTSVVFGQAPNNEVGDSQVQLENPQSVDDGPVETVAPADGTTSVSVYVRLRCDCDPTGGLHGTYFDGPDGNGEPKIGWVQMPVPTENGDASDLLGARAELVPSGASHATISAAYDATQLDQSNQPLGKGEAYTGPLAQTLFTNSEVAVFKITDSVAEDVRLQAFDVTNNQFVGDSTKPITIHFQPTAPYQTQITASPSSGVPADGTTTSKVTVTVRDIQGNPISGRNVLLSSHSTTAGINPSSASTGTDGAAKFSVTETKAGTTRFSATDQQAGPLGYVDVTFVPASPSILNSSISISPTTVPADGSSSAQITVNLQDSAGNPIAGLPVTMGQAGGHSTITPASAGSDTTNAQGNATFKVTDTQAESVYYQATVSGSIPFVLASLTPVIFVPGNVSTVTSTVTADLTSVPADGTSASTITVTLRDANDAMVSGKSVTLTSTGAAAVSPAGTQVTGSHGTAVFTVRDSTPESVTVTATDTSDSNVTVGTLTIIFTGPPDATTSSVTASPTSAAVNSIVTVRATVRDVNSFPVSGQHVFLNSVGAAYLISTSPTTGVTGSDGMVTFLVSASAPGPVSFPVIDQTTSSQLGSADVTFFGAPIGAHSTISANPVSVPADGGTASTVTVTLHDTNDTPVSGQPVSLSGNSVHTVISPAGPTQTDVNGVVTFAVTDTQVEKVTYTATAGALTTNPVAVQFTQPNTEAGTSTVLANPTAGIPADGVAASAVLVTLLGGNGSPLAGHTATLSCPGATATTGSSSSDANGEVSFSVTATTPGTVTCTATDTTSGAVLQQTPQLTFVVPPSEANQSTLVALPTVEPNDGTMTTIVVTLRAADGSALIGHLVTLGQGTGSSTITPASATTGAGGVATFSAGDVTAEAVTYTATDTTANPDVVIDQHAVVTYSDEKSASTATAVPASVPADGVSAASVIVTLTAAGSPIVGHQVTLSAQSGSSHVTVSTNPTGQDGKAIFQVTDTVAQVVRYTVLDTTLGLTLSAQPQVTFTSDVTAPTVTSMTPTSGLAGQDVTITGTNLQGAAVTFGSASAGTVTINVAGTKVHATAPGGTGTVTVTVTTAGGTVTAGHFTYGAASPVVTSMSASYGPAGTAVTLVGTDLDNAAVTFGAAAATISSDTATKIELTAPPGQGITTVVVHSAKGTAGAGAFTYTGGTGAPVIKSMSPTVGADGTQVTFTGSRLTKATAMLFGTQRAAKVSDVAAKLVVIAPAGTGSVPVVIVTAKGATFAGTFAFTSSVAAPTVTGMAVGSGHTGDQVTITGAHLDGAAVDFGGEPASIVSNVGTTLVVRVPSGNGVTTVSIVTPGGRTAAGPFTVLPSPPAVTSYTPHKGTAGTTVTFTGTNLDGAVSVKFGAVSATIVSDSRTKLVITAPAGTGKLTIRVTTAIGAVNVTGKFTYT